MMEIAKEWAIFILIAAESCTCAALRGTRREIVVEKDIYKLKRKPESNSLLHSLP